MCAHTQHTVLLLNSPIMPWLLMHLLFYDYYAYLSLTVNQMLKPLTIFFLV